MTQRPAFFTTDDNRVMSRTVEFEWMPGLSETQKKRSVANMHKALNDKALEISTKSDVALGVKLSAFNLKLDGIPLECVYQSSKVFKNGGPYRDLMNVHPKQAKGDERLRNSGSLTGFEYNGHLWKSDTGTAFYDYIYVNAVKNSLSIDEIIKITEYNFFTDIEFNPNKSVNTQARSVAIIKSLLNFFGEIPDVSLPEEFLKYHKIIVKG